MTIGRSSYHRYYGGRLGLRDLRAPEDPPTAVKGIEFLAFPNAGGQSLVFRELAASLPSNWAFAAIDFPGHGWACGPPIDDADSLVDLSRRELSDRLQSRPVLLGFSFGGYVAFSLAQRLEAEGLSPAALVLIAIPPPHRRPDYVSLASLDESALVHFLVQIGGFPVDWANQPEILNLFLPALRADLVAFESFNAARQKVHAPTLVLASESDALCRPEHLPDWEQYCSDCRAVSISGDHFFVQSQPAAVASIVQAFLQDVGVACQSRAQGIQ